MRWETMQDTTEDPSGGIVWGDPIADRRGLIKLGLWPSHPAPKGQVVYRVYDAATDELLYVGCTNDPRRRRNEHHWSGKYDRAAVRYEVSESMSTATAYALERSQILELRPRDNVRLTRVVRRYGRAARRAS